MKLLILLIFLIPILNLYLFNIMLDNINDFYNFGTCKYPVIYNEEN